MRTPDASSWRGLIALVLALGLVAGLVLLAVSELVHEGHVSNDEATLFATVLGAIVGAVATYLGMREGHE